MRPALYIAHCIDTEGPLSETLEQTFGRLESIFGLTFDPSEKMLDDLQNMRIDLGGLEEQVARTFSKDLLRYNASWQDIDSMLARIMAPAFRDRFRDDRGRGWVYNWFCCDHVDYDVNPRGRDLGLHRVFDFYASALERYASAGDRIEFHFHPHPLNRRASSNAVHWFASSTKLFEILASRIIDRHWFPCANRPGFHTERPDSHWFLEQFVPFDFANQRVRVSDEQPDVSAGRYGDWRRAPLGWRPYRPSHDDYQAPGTCRRTIFRCLNVGTRFRELTQMDVDEAFAEAIAHGSAVLAFTDHDFRDIGPDVERVHEFIQSRRERFPDVEIRNADVREAARAALGRSATADFRLTMEVTDGLVSIRSTAPTFGPQPFLAIKTKDGRYFHDALDIQVPFSTWTYVLDEHTLPMAALETIAVAANSGDGTVAISLLDCATGRVTETTA